MTRPSHTRGGSRMRESRTSGSGRLSMIVVLGAIGTLLACAIIEAAIRSLPPSQSLADGMPTTEDK
jgi:hypothetical protein